MHDSMLKTTLISQADRAYKDLIHNRDILFVLVDSYISDNPPENYANKYRADSLLEACSELRSLPYMLYDTIQQWKRNDPHVLSKDGIELTIINEIAANMQALFQFFMLRDISIGAFRWHEVSKAYTDLVRCNRLLTKN